MIPKFHIRVVRERGMEFEHYGRPDIGTGISIERINGYFHFSSTSEKSAYCFSLKLRGLDWKSARQTCFEMLEMMAIGTFRLSKFRNSRYSHLSKVRSSRF